MVSPLAWGRGVDAAARGGTGVLGNRKIAHRRCGYGWYLQGELLAAQMFEAAGGDQGDREDGEVVGGVQ